MNNKTKINLDEITYEEYLNDDIYNIDPGGDISDGGEYVDFLIENLTKEPIPREVPEEYIDQIVKDEDYMEFRAYLERIADDTELIKKVMEYVEFNYPEFFEDSQVANNEKIPKQNIRADKPLNKKIPSDLGSEEGKLTHRQLTQTGTEIQDVLTW
ncbi:MAG TPA: hypothetical protein PK674_03700 [Candidatus Absconditabacterales bacterium]|nr:hypothetical protein [Candidatus Absconditabacterales bacterium]HOQ78884.1 hypothetical protein [Candidatus Absconditabacterales bacterium]HPK27847.1 hypothetical protein [Candidatus Absconditabacterales bacterium]